MTQPNKKSQSERRSRTLIGSLSVLVLCFGIVVGAQAVYRASVESVPVESGAQQQQQQAQQQPQTQETASTTSDSPARTAPQDADASSTEAAPAQTEPAQTDSQQGASQNQADPPPSTSEQTFNTSAVDSGSINTPQEATITPQAARTNNGTGTARPQAAANAANASQISMFRLYNKWNGEHFYTSDASERANLIGVGWSNEGTGWTAPATGDAVYRLYNPYAGDHHYTTSTSERDTCVKSGWRYEGIGWYSDPNKGVPLYREYNPWAQTGSHNYTTSKNEHDNLVKVGWRDEGIAWYGVTPQNGDKTKPAQPSNPTQPTTPAPTQPTTPTQPNQPKNYSITYNLQGGSATGTFPTSFNKNTAEIVLPNTVTRYGYTFAGWTTSDDQEPEMSRRVSTQQQQSVVAKAHWTEATYTVSLDLNATDASWVDGATSATVSTTGGKPVHLPGTTDVSRPGYELLGWNTTATAATGSFVNTPQADYKIPATPTTLYAQWRQLSYTVNFDTDGSTERIDAKRNVHWSDASLLPDATPARPGFEFEGWFTQRGEAGMQVAASATYGSLETTLPDVLNVTLYAHWKQLTPAPVDPEPQPDDPQPVDPKPTPDPNPVNPATVKFNVANVTGTELYTMNGNAAQKVSAPDAAQIKARPNNYLAHVLQEGQSDIWLPVKSVETFNNTQYLKLDANNYYDNALARDGLYVPLSGGRNKTDFATISGYVPANATAYANMARFMPYYDAKAVVDVTNWVVKTHPNNMLYTTQAIGIFPVNDQKERMVYVAANDVSSVKGVRVQFGDNDATTKTYPLTYVGVREGIASYRVGELDVFFTFPTQVVETTSDSFTKVKDAASKLDYDKDIYTAYKRDQKDNNDNKAIQRRNFNDSVKKDLDAAIGGYAANFDEVMPLGSNNNIARAVVQGWLSDTTELRRFMNTYNYVDRWYGFSIGGINMRDVVMFDNSVLPGAKSTKELIKKNCDDSGADGRSGGGTNTWYKAFLSGPMGKGDAASFVEYFMRYYAGEKDVNDWIVKNFKHGYIAEARCDDPDLRKRIWTLIKRNSELKDQQMVLPVLSYDTGHGLYMIGFSVALFWGDMQIYGDYRDNPESAKKIGDEIKRWSDEYNHMFDNASKLSTRMKNRFKQHIALITDQTKTNAKTENKEVAPGFWMPVVVSKGEQFRGNDAIKEIFLPLGKYRGHDRAGAVTYTAADPTRDFIHFANGNLRNQYNTLDHEMGHLLTVAWCNNYSPRHGNEAINDGYANEVELDLNMNFRKTFGRDSGGLSNLSPERIMTEDKYQSYFKGEFDNLYIVDHLQAMGYLQLTPQQQASITSKHSYAGNRTVSRWYKGMNNKSPYYWSADDLKALNLNTFEDLYNNGLAVRAGCRDDLQGHVNIDQNSYHFSKIAYTSWYEPYNPNEAPDTETYKRNGFLLGGYGGFDNGTIKYLANGKMSGNDQARFNAIIPQSEYPQFYTNNNFDWKKYRLAKEKESDEISNNNPYFDEEALIAYLKNSMEKPGQSRTAGVSGQTPLANIKNARENVYRYLQRATNEYTLPFSGAGAKQVQKISSAQEFVNKISTDPNGLYELTTDIDMSQVSLGGKDAYITQTFIGKLAFKGHTVKNAAAPLFKRVSNSYLANVSVTGTNNSAGKLAIQEAWSMRVTENVGSATTQSVQSDAFTMATPSDPALDAITNKQDN